MTQYSTRQFTWKGIPDMDNGSQHVAYLTQCVTFSISSKVITTHYGDVIMSTIASQITSLTIVYSTVYSGADQRKHQSSASLAFVWGIHRWPVNSPHKGPVTRKMSTFDDVIMNCMHWYKAKKEYVDLYNVCASGAGNIYTRKIWSTLSIQMFYLS